MRPDDHHVEPLFAGLGHGDRERVGSGDTPGSGETGGGGARRGDPSVKWKLLIALAGLAALAWLISHQAF